MSRAFSNYPCDATESQTNALVVDGRRSRGIGVRRTWVGPPPRNVQMSELRTIEILQTAAMPTHDPEAFDRQFQIHRHYLAADPIPADIATRVRGIAAGGARRIDARGL